MKEVLSLILVLLILVFNFIFVIPNPVYSGTVRGIFHDPILNIFFSNSLSLSK